MTTAYLADTSAWHRSGRGETAERWAELVSTDALAVSAPIRLELLLSSRDERDYRAFQTELDALAQLPADDAVARRAEEIQRNLVGRGHHRGPTPIDLLIAAAAELHGLTLLHYDRHFDLIAEVTGQPAEWVAPRGTLD